MKVYISGPYGRRKGLENWECEDNVRKAVDLARQLILLGFVVFCPHLYHYIHREWEESPDENVWLGQCLAFVRDCDLLIRMKGKSKGADIEVQEARNYDIPVIYCID